VLVGGDPQLLAQLRDGPKAYLGAFAFGAFGDCARHSAHVAGGAVVDDCYSDLKLCSRLAHGPVTCVEIAKRASSLLASTASTECACIHSRTRPARSARRKTRLACALTITPSASTSATTAAPPSHSPRDAPWEAGSSKRRSACTRSGRRAWSGSSSSRRLAWRNILRRGSRVGPSVSSRPPPSRPGVRLASAIAVIWGRGLSLAGPTADG